MKEKIAGRKKKTASNSPATGVYGRRPTERHEASREFAQASTANVRETFEQTKSGIQDLDNVLERTLTTATRSATDFNLQLIEIARSNANSAFDFARQLIGMQSPAELLGLSVAHARKQFESFTGQTQQLATRDQKGAADAAEPLATGTASATNNVARSGKRG